MAAADPGAVIAGFASDPSPEALVRFRERRLIHAAPADRRREAAKWLARAFAESRPAEDAAAFDRYLTFMIEVETLRLDRLRTLDEHLSRLPRCSITDLLRIGDRSFDGVVKKLRARLRGMTSDLPVPDLELRLHNLNGSLVDVAAGVMRTVNEAVRRNGAVPDRRLNREDLERAVRRFDRAVQVAGNVNSLEWLVDSVTFGEFQVTEAYTEQRLGFRLDYSDERRSLVRSLALRRRLVLRTYGRRTSRFVTAHLSQLEIPILTGALSHYLGEMAPDVFEGELGRLLNESAASLGQVGAEDDLLLAAAGEDARIGAHYAAAMGLRWYAIAGRAAARLQPSLRHRGGALHIPLMLIAAELEDGDDGAHVAGALEGLTIALPARHHNQLALRPFVRVSQGEAYPFFVGDVGQWNVAVREALIQGGSVGKSVGGVWETFIEKSFDDTDWRVVGRGVKLREHGKTLTDVDLLLQRDELLLVVQIKALVGAGHSPHDHWKNRQTVELGCRQARLAADFLEAHPEAVVAQCGRRGAAVVRVIQPVVITNVAHFEGWAQHGVPIIASTTQKAICDGSRVDYVDSGTQGIVSTEHFVRPEDLTTDTILSLIRDPPELRIAPERHGVHHIPQKIGEVGFLIPDITLRPPDGKEPTVRELAKPGRRADG